MKKNRWLLGLGGSHTFYSLSLSSLSLPPESSALMLSTLSPLWYPPGPAPRFLFAVCRLMTRSRVRVLESEEPWLERSELLSESLSSPLDLGGGPGRRATLSSDSSRFGVVRGDVRGESGLVTGGEAGGGGVGRAEPTPPPPPPPREGIGGDEGLEAGTEDGWADEAVGEGGGGFNLLRRATTRDGGSQPTVPRTRRHFWRALVRYAKEV